MAAQVPRRVSHQYLIHSAPAEVFRALADPHQLIRWLCDTAEIDARVGGTYRMGWTGGPQHAGTVVEFEPGRRIVLEWTWPGVELSGTRLGFEVEPVEGGALLKVDHAGFPRQEEWTDLYGGAEWGWTYFAMNLKALLETGRDLRSPRDG